MAILGWGEPTQYNGRLWSVSPRVITELLEFVDYGSLQEVNSYVVAEGFRIILPGGLMRILCN